MIWIKLALFTSLLGAVYSFQGTYDYSAPDSYDYNAIYEDDNEIYNMYANSGYPTHKRQPSRMMPYQKSYQPKPVKETVPVVIKKKKQKKRKTLSVQHGFFISGGTAMFGKFKDLHSCIKACEITPTCFAGDFNPWLGKCFFHGNVTACGSMQAHKAITHFKKVPCDVLGSPRGIVVLGISVVGGVELKSTENLQDCIKRCTSAGGGVASMDTLFQPQNQVCCGVNYDFATHKCYIMPCPNTFALLDQLYCNDGVVQEPLNSLAAPTVVSITICPMTT